MFRDTEHEPGRTRSVRAWPTAGSLRADHHPSDLQARLPQALHERCRGCFAHG
jgi:hypothetical protein